MLPWGIYELHRHNAQPHVVAWFCAGVFVCLAVPMSIWDVAQHLRHYHNPELQKFIVRIIWMVPIYAIDSWVALRFGDLALYFDTARACYEAYVIYNFYVYLLKFLYQRDPKFDETIAHRKNHPHLKPFCCFPSWKMGLPFLHRIHTGPIAYVVVQLICTIVSLITQGTGGYKEGQFTFRGSWLWITFLTSFAQAWAMYCLVLFYVAFKEDLAKCKPLAKLLVIKAVVFFSFWQSVLISGLEWYKPEIFSSSSETWSYYQNDKNVAGAFQNFLICIEMFIAALVHHRVFSYREHLTNEDVYLVTRKMSICESISALFDVRDVQDDVVGMWINFS